jgi:hypothetical protein
VGGSNTALRALRRRQLSRVNPGEPLGRQELADLVNAHVEAATARPGALDANYIGKLERGVISWPGRHYRAGLREVLGVGTDRELGLTRSRQVPPEALSSQTPTLPGTGLPANSPASPIRSVADSTLGDEESSRRSLDAGSAAGILDSASAPAAEVAGLSVKSDRTLSMEAGDDVQRRTFFRSLLLTSGAMAAAPDRLRALVREAAHLSTALSLSSLGPQMVHPVLEDAARAVRDLTTSYVVASDVPATMLATLRLRGHLSETLLTGAMPACHERDLRVLLGATCLLLASLSHDVGEPAAGLAQADAAATFAAQAKHPELLAWAYCTKAMICTWAQRPADVLVHTASGLAIGGGPVVGLRLAGLRSRALAQSGRLQEALTLLRQSQDSAESSSSFSSLADLGDLFTFPASRQHYYAAATYALLGDRQGVEQSVALVEGRGPTPGAGVWPVSRALSRGHLALAMLSDDGPQAAHEALAPVFALPPHARVVQVGQTLAEVARRVASPAFQGSPSARALSDALQDLAAPW